MNPGQKLNTESAPAKVKTRYAPSPTGFLHIGGARTALFNYLFTKSRLGSFILRMEDTDLKRSELEYETDILKSLKWLGIEWDEGPAPISQREIKDYIGEYGPYRQSERTEIYQRYLEKLLAEDKAYYCFCSEKDLEAQRQYQISIGQAHRYNGKCSQLPQKETKKYLSERKKHIIRFRVPSKKLKFNDLIRDKLEFDTGLFGDFSIAKDLKTPLYNFAVVVDDFEMQISHVIRGEDLLPNTPKQILIQEALNLPAPQYAHLPLILGQDRSKLSKRHGSGAIYEYKKAGYLSETLVNFMAFLGWNPGEEREIYSLSSLIKEFSLERVQKGGAIFNVKRLDFLNGFYIRQRSIEKLTELCLPYLIEAGLIEELKLVDEHSFISPPRGARLFEEEKPKYKIKATQEVVGLDWIQKIIGIYQERLKRLSEISELADFFFKDKLEYNKELLKWNEMSEKEIASFLDRSEKILSKIEERDWTKENLEEILMSEAEKTGDRGKLLWPLRVALSGKQASAPPFEIAEILGKEKTLKRIRKAGELIK